MVTHRQDEEGRWCQRVLPQVLRSMCDDQGWDYCRPAWMEPGDEWDVGGMEEWEVYGMEEWEMYGEEPPGIAGRKD